MAGLTHPRRCATVFASCLTVLALGVTSAQAVPPDRIAFTRAGDVFTVRPDGADVRSVTRSADEERHPAWSPSHARIAFAVGRSLHVADADGAGERQVLTLSSRYDSVGWIAWAPAGDRLAFTSDRVEVRGGIIRICSQVWVVDASGAGAERILAGRLSATGLTWSPDGRFLAASFEQASTTLPCRTGQEPGIYRLRPDGSHLRALDAPFGTDPDWSPDGRWIVYRDWGRTCHACGQIKVMRPDGSRQHLLADPPPRYLGYYAPAWSPSGGRIAFAAQRDGRFTLWRMNADGSHVRRVRRHADDLDW